MTDKLQLNPTGVLTHSGTKAPTVADAREAGKQFEAFFMTYVLKEMKQNTLSSGLFGDGLGSDTYMDLFNEQLGKIMSEGKGLGLGDMIAHQLEQRLNLGKKAPDAPDTKLNNTNQTQPVPTPTAKGSSGPTASLVNGQISFGDLGAASFIPQKAFEAEVASLVTPKLQSMIGPDGKLRLPQTANEDGMQAPLSSGQISSEFGIRRDPITGQSRFHEGVDIAATAGTAIHAAADGRVVFSGIQGGYGNTVIIEHSNGYRTRYAHAESLTVRAGDQVEAGQIIGKVGSTGRSTGSHLHFEVTKDGQHLDPGKILAKVIA